MTTYRPLHATTQTFVSFENGSRKFWTVRADINNKRITAFWGRLGTAGSKKVSTFESHIAARDYLEMKIEEKLRKGYVQVTGTMPAYQTAA